MTNSDPAPETSSSPDPAHPPQQSKLTGEEPTEAGGGGDDFDDFAEGHDDDFGDFDDGFQEPDADLAEPEPASIQPSQQPTPPYVVRSPSLLVPKYYAMLIRYIASFNRL